MCLPPARDDAPRLLLRGRVGEEVVDEDVIELETCELVASEELWCRQGRAGARTLGFEDRKHERAVELGGQRLLGGLRAHQHRLVRPKLDLRVLLVGAQE